MVAHFSGMTVKTSSVNPRVISNILTTCLVNNREFLNQKYTIEGLSARQLASRISFSHSSVNEALKRFGIIKIKQRSGHVPYGYRVKSGRMISCLYEQKIINQIKQKAIEGWPLAKISKWLTSRSVPSPKGKSWYPKTLRRLISINASPVKNTQ